MSLIKRILYAPGIHQGGGESLLLPLLTELKDDRHVVFILDERLRLPHEFPVSERIIYVHKNLFSRLRIEWQLRSLVTAKMEVLCFGNLLPLWAHRGKQIVFVQNRYLIDDIDLLNLPLLDRIRVKNLRWCLRSGQHHVKRFVVQTPTMQRLLKDALGREAGILPFTILPSQNKDSHDSRNKKQYDFLYVASGESHKNHRQLILAWVVLAKKNQSPHLCLTLDERRFPQLCSWISSRVKTQGLQVTMTGNLSQSSVLNLYGQARALIYPSLLESFGLPILEAVAVGLPILAADTDYVRDVVHPTAVFNPNSSLSIAQAVLEFSYEPAPSQLNY